MTVAMRRPVRAMAAVGALALVLGACGGDDGGGEDGDAATDESSGADESTTTTLSPEDEVIAAYDRAQEAVEAAFDPPNPEHPDLLASYAGPLLERQQARLAEYQVDGVSDVLVSKESDPQVVEIGDTTAVVEDCMTEVLQYTDTETREPQGEPRTYTALTESDLELIDGTWKIVDGRTIEEAC